MCNRHALIAGGAGFIGAHLAARLLELGWRVTVWDDLSSGRRDSLPTHPRLSFRCHNVANELPMIDRVDLVVHLASPCIPADYVVRDTDTLDANDLGTRRLIGLALASSAPFVFASSSEVYGDCAENRGQLETDAAILPPPHARRAVYPVAKRFAEELVMAAVRSRHLDGRVARLFNVYGPGLDVRSTGAQRVIPAFVRAALDARPILVYGDGLQVRSFCWIDDAVNALLRLCQLPGLAGTVVNIGAPEPITINALVVKIADILGTSDVRHVPRDEHEPVWRQPDISKARNLLGWTPSVSLDDGLRRYVQWLLTQPTLDDGVSVVVPTYGRSIRLGRLVRALDALNPAPSSVVLVDDATPGGLPDWIFSWEAASKAFPVRILRHNNNRGPAAARNTGVKACRTAVVAFTDDDCEPTPGWIAALSNRISTEPRRIAAVGGMVRPRGHDLYSRYFALHRTLEPPTDLAYVVTANAAFRRDLVVSVGGFDERISQPGGEDPGLSFALAREGFSFVHEPRAEVIHDFRSSFSEFVRTFYRYGRGCSHVFHHWPGSAA